MVPPPRRMDFPQGSLNDLQFGPDERVLAIRRRGTIVMGSQDGRVYAWDLTTRQLVAMSAPQPEYVDTLAVSTTGWVVYAGFGKMLRLWNPQTGQNRLFPAARPTSNLILGPDGTSIIFGTADGGIEFWDAGTGQRLGAIKVPGS